MLLYLPLVVRHAGMPHVDYQALCTIAVCNQKIVFKSCSGSTSATDPSFGFSEI